jgi:hypothetical protein
LAAHRGIRSKKKRKGTKRAGKSSEVIAITLKLSESEEGYAIVKEQREAKKL